MMVTNQKEDTIDQPEPDDFHVENEPPIDTGQKVELENVETEKSEEVKRIVTEVEPPIEEKESEKTVPMDMDFTTAIMEDDLEAFDAIRKLFQFYILSQSQIHISRFENFFEL